MGEAGDICRDCGRIFGWSNAAWISYAPVAVLGSAGAVSKMARETRVVVQRHITHLRLPGQSIGGRFPEEALLLQRATLRAEFRAWSGRYGFPPDK